MDNKSVQHFLRTYGRTGSAATLHHQRASAFILATLLMFSFATHMAELDTALLRMLAQLGTDCVWCSVTPY
ncbi:hypothetical protein DXT88_12445 [Herbaspirillum lusitanum]|uniref:hypothetical protein n=1 Tax=Herbaspirillum lusitanum TaxID=213312 RepID=UPI0022382E8C|nr:hypothetical protein [Herbaspirillum lusitanum]MCW5298982.1 hypothetical protein [Herbaspirillum lusitanum]